jgi:hypothetical protein
MLCAGLADVHAQDGHHKGKQLRDISLDELGVHLKQQHDNKRALGEHFKRLNTLHKNRGGRVPATAARVVVQETSVSPVPARASIVSSSSARIVGMGIGDENSSRRPRDIFKYSVHHVKKHLPPGNDNGITTKTAQSIAKQNTTTPALGSLEKVEMIYGDQI